MPLLNILEQGQTWGYDVVSAESYPGMPSSSSVNIVWPKTYRYTTDYIFVINTSYSTVSGSYVSTGGVPSYDASPNAQTNVTSLVQSDGIFSGGVSIYAGNPEFLQYKIVGAAEPLVASSADLSFRSAIHVLHLRKRSTGEISIPSNTSDLGAIGDTPSGQGAYLTDATRNTVPGPLVLVPHGISSAPVFSSTARMAFVLAIYTGPISVAAKIPVDFSWGVKDYIDLPPLFASDHVTCIRLGFVSTPNEADNIFNKNIVVNGGDNIIGALSVAVYRMLK